MTSLRPACRLPLLLVLAALAALASGCMWGIVRDADTGQPLSGVTVTYTDSYGQTASTTTDAHGAYGFGAPVSVAPAMGAITLKAEAAGYESVSVARDANYDDNPAATLDNLSSFWEVQSLALVSDPVLYHNGQGGYTLSLPKSWKTENDAWGPGSVLATPPTGNYYYPADITVGSIELPAGRTLEAWLDDTLSGLCNVTADCKELEGGETTIGGVRALWTVVSYTVTAGSPVSGGLYGVGQQLEELAYFLKKGSDGYILDFTATAGAFPTMRSMFDHVADSFQFENLSSAVDSP